MGGQTRFHDENDVIEDAVDSMLVDDSDSTRQTKKRRMCVHTVTTDEVTQARAKMDRLLQTRDKAHEELKEADKHLIASQERVELAKANIAVTIKAVRQGTEELTDALLQEPTHWNALYRKMVEYKEKHGNVDVKRNPLKAEKEANPEIVKLGSWVGRVRLEARRPQGHPEHIEPYKVIALNRLCFNWDPRENYWMDKYEELKQYMKKHGKNKTPTRKEPLGVWCDGQVLEYNKFHSHIKPCYITQERIEMLDKIGFVWDRMGTAWKDAYEELKKYRRENGHCHVPVNYGDKTLFRWIAKQRKKYKNYQEGTKPSLTDEQVKLLRDVDFFEPSEQRLAKFNAKKEKVLKKEKRSSLSNGKGRGRPKSKSLIPAEAQQAMILNQNSPVGSIMPFPIYATPHPMMPIHYQAIPSHDVKNPEMASKSTKVYEKSSEQQREGKGSIQCENNKSKHELVPTTEEEHSEENGIASVSIVHESANESKDKAMKREQNNEGIEDVMVEQNPEIKKIQIKDLIGKEVSDVKDNENVKNNEERTLDINKQETADIKENENIEIDPETLDITKNQTLEINEGENVGLKESENLEIKKEDNLVINESENLDIEEVENLGIKENVNLEINEIKTLDIKENEKLENSEMQRRHDEENGKEQNAIDILADDGNVFEELQASTTESIKTENAKNDVDPEDVGVQV